MSKAGEAPYDSQAVRPLGGLHTTRLGCPCSGECGGDEGGLGLRSERDEALQQIPGQFEPHPERAFDSKIAACLAKNALSDSAQAVAIWTSRSTSGRGLPSGSRCATSG